MAAPVAEDPADSAVEDLAEDLAVPDRVDLGIDLLHLVRLEWVSDGTDPGGMDMVAVAAVA